MRERERKKERVQVIAAGAFANQEKQSMRAGECHACIKNKTDEHLNGLFIIVAVIHTCMDTKSRCVGKKVFVCLDVEECSHSHAYVVSIQWSAQVKE